VMRHGQSWCLFMVAGQDLARGTVAAVARGPFSFAPSVFCRHTTAQWTATPDRAAGKWISVSKQSLVDPSRIAAFQPMLG